MLVGGLGRSHCCAYAQLQEEGVSVSQEQTIEAIAAASLDVMVYSGLGMDSEELRIARERLAPTQVSFVVSNLMSHPHPFLLPASCLGPPAHIRTPFHGLFCD